MSLMVAVWNSTDFLMMKLSLLFSHPLIVTVLIVADKREFRRLRNTGFRSNTNSLNHKPVIYKNGYIESLISLFDPAKL